MGRMGKGLVAVAALAAAAWAGGWFYVKGKIPQALEAQTAALKARGYEVKHDPVQIGGFPFAHKVRLTDILVAGKRQELGQTIETKASIPWLDAEFSMMSPTTGRITGMSEAALEMAFGGRAFSGAVKPTNLRGSFSGVGDSSWEMAADAMAYDLKAKGEAKAEGLSGGSGEARGLTAKGSFAAKGDLWTTDFSTASAKGSMSVLAPDLMAEDPAKLVETAIRFDASAPMSGSIKGSPAARSSEMNLPAQLVIAAKTGDAPESMIPIQLDKVKLAATQDDKRVTFDASGDGLMYGVEQKEGSMIMKLDARMQGFSVKGGADTAFFTEEMTPEKISGGKPPNLLKANLSYEGAARSSSTRFEMKDDNPAEGATAANYTASFDTGPSQVSFSLVGGRMEAGGGAEGVKFSFVGPMKAEGEIARIGGKLQAPFAKKDDAQPFLVDYSLEGVKLSDQIWAMIDPTKALDRTINKVRAALSGDVKINIDIADPALEGGMVELPDEPFVPGAIKIDDVTIDALGLVAKATGAFKIDPAKMEAPPAGEATVSLKGWEKTLESLVTAGALPPEQAMMAQGFIGMMGKDGAAEGEKIFVVKMSPDEGLSVNDMPLGMMPGMDGGDLEEDAPSEDELPPEEEAPDATPPDDAEAPAVPDGGVRSLNPPQ